MGHTKTTAGLESVMVVVLVTASKEKSVSHGTPPGRSRVFGNNVRRRPLVGRPWNEPPDGYISLSTREFCFSKTFLPQTMMRSFSMSILENVWQHCEILMSVFLTRKEVCLEEAAWHQHSLMSLARVVNVCKKTEKRVALV